MRFFPSLLTFFLLLSSLPFLPTPSFLQGIVFIMWPGLVFLGISCIWFICFCACRCPCFTCGPCEPDCCTRCIGRTFFFVPCCCFKNDRIILDDLDEDDEGLYSHTYPGGCGGVVPSVPITMCKCCSCEVCCYKRKDLLEHQKYHKKPQGYAADARTKIIVAMVFFILLGVYVEAVGECSWLRRN